MADGGDRDQDFYDIKQRTVVIEVGDTIKVTPDILIEILSTIVDVYHIEAVVRRNNFSYEVSVKKQDYVRFILQAELVHQGKPFYCRRLLDITKLVSIYNVPYYISNQSLTDQFVSLGCNVVSDYCMLTRVINGYDVHVGNRRVLLAVTDAAMSLPSRLEVQAHNGMKFCRLSYKGKTRSCYSCGSVDHLARDCQLETDRDSVSTSSTLSTDCDSDTTEQHDDTTDIRSATEPACNPILEHTDVTSPSSDNSVRSDVIEIQEIDAPQPIRADRSPVAEVVMLDAKCSLQQLLDTSVNREMCTEDVVAEEIVVELTFNQVLADIQRQRVAAGLPPLYVICPIDSYSSINTRRKT